MYVKVRFSSSYSKKWYSYLYDLPTIPNVGDFFIVRSPSGYSIVECMKVEEGDAPKIADQYILGTFDKKYWDEVYVRHIASNVRA